MLGAALPGDQGRKPWPLRNSLCLPQFQKYLHEIPLMALWLLVRCWATHMKRILPMFLCTCLLWAVPFTNSAVAGQSTSTTADNTKVNKDTSSPTADKGKNNLSDREVMAHIRRDVVKDKTLSMYAHNVKIVSSNGKVTLRGPVHTDQEKQTIEQYAKKYAGDMNVTDEITVKADSK